VPSLAAHIGRIVQQLASRFGRSDCRSLYLTLRKRERIHLVPLGQNRLLHRIASYCARKVLASVAERSSLAKARSVWSSFLNQVLSPSPSSSRLRNNRGSESTEPESACHSVPPTECASQNGFQTIFRSESLGLGFCADRSSSCAARFCPRQTANRERPRR